MLTTGSFENQTPKGAPPNSKACHTRHLHQKRAWRSDAEANGPRTVSAIRLSQEREKMWHLAH